MTAKYTLPSGSRISVFFWSEYAKNEDWRKYAEVRPIDSDGKLSRKEAKKPLHKDARGLYIEWFDKQSGRTEKVYLNEFDHIPYEKLVETLDQCIAQNDPWLVFDDDILATFLKESDKVAIEADVPVFDVVIPFMGIGLYGDKTQQAICRLSEKQYDKSAWHYKVTLEAPGYDDALVSKSYYFSDLCSLMKKGIFRLVDMEKLEKAEQEAMAAQSAADANRPFARVVKGIAQALR